MQPPATDTPVVAAPPDEQSLRNGAVIVPRAVRMWRIEGPKAVESLNGLVTNDVARLADGAGCYAAALTVKGKIVADMRVLARSGGFDVITDAAAGDGWAEMLKKYLNPRLAKATEVDTRSCVVMGRDAAAAVAAALSCDGDALRSLAAHHFVRVADATVVRDPRVDVECFEVLDGDTPVKGASASGDLWEAHRIARGWPLWGFDMNDTTLAQEANLDELGAISFDKGCYVGQETVARVHFRGHVNRRLRSASFDAADAVPRGAELFDETGKSVGEVRSSAVIQEAGFAIVMARRETESTGELFSRWDGREARVTLIT